MLTTKLICAFVFTPTKAGFLMMRLIMVILHLFFDFLATNVVAMMQTLDRMHMPTAFEPRYEKTGFLHRRK